MSLDSTTDILRAHFEKLKETLPKVYESSIHEEETTEGKLFDLLKRSLTVIEAVYFQNSDMFTVSRAEEYKNIIDELRTMGFDYSGNQDLLSKASAAAIIGAKLPMEKAKGKTKSEKSGSSRKAM
jgi:hypothetical protein